MQIQVKFEKGVFKPLRKIEGIKEGEQVEAKQKDSEQTPAQRATCGIIHHPGPLTAGIVLRQILYNFYPASPALDEETPDLPLRIGSM